MKEQKVSDALATALAAAKDDEAIVVIIELESVDASSLSREMSGASRQEQIAARRETFDSGAEPVINSVKELGGTVLRKGWLNNSIEVSVPASSCEGLGELPIVKKLDLGRGLTRE